jgi:hypothetical protein
MGLIFLPTLISVFVGVTTIILAGSMVAVSIDLNELSRGKRQEGMFCAATTFSGKATTGVGGGACRPRGSRYSLLRGKQFANCGRHSLFLIYMRPVTNTRQGQQPQIVRN